MNVNAPYAEARFHRDENDYRRIATSYTSEFEFHVCKLASPTKELNFGILLEGCKGSTQATAPILQF